MVSISNYIIIIINFLLPPVSVILSTYKILVNDKSQYAFVFNICLLFSIMNMNKELISDIHAYSLWYNDTRYDWMKHIFIEQREPLYIFVNYLSNYLGLSFKQFIFAITFISYGLIFRAIAQYDSKNKWLLYVVIAFLPQIFLISGHLVRQFISVSILMYSTNHKGKKRKILILMSGLIHYSALIFLVADVIYTIIVKKSTKYNTISIISFIATFITLIFITKIISEIFFFEYTALNRLNLENIWKPDRISITTVLVYVFSVLILFIKLLKKIDFVYVDYYVLTIITFVLLQLNNEEIFLRMSFYLYFFLPVSSITNATVSVSKLLNNFIVKISLTSFIIGYFIFTIYNAQWSYDLDKYILNYFLLVL